MTKTMRAAVIDAPGGPDVLVVRDVAIPQPGHAEVRIRVRAFGLNRSELHFRSGSAYSGSFPRIPGIEAAGEIDLAPGDELAVGQKVVTMMGGMGRLFDGGYAEYLVVPTHQVIPIQTSLPWATIGAIPERDCCTIG